MSNVTDVKNLHKSRMISGTSSTQLHLCELLALLALCPPLLLPLSLADPIPLTAAAPPFKFPTSVAIRPLFARVPSPNKGNTRTSLQHPCSPASSSSSGCKLHCP